MGQHINPLLFEGEYLVRQIDKGDEVWFVGADVCKVLALTNPHSSLALLDDRHEHRNQLQHRQAALSEPVPVLFPMGVKS